MAANTQVLNTNEISIDNVINIVSENSKIKLGSKAISSVKKCRKFLDEQLQSDRVYYGINTGFGSLCNRKISSGDLEKLQHNLVISHACGIGNPVPIDIVKIMMLLKIHALSLGHSGTPWAATVKDD